MKVVNETEFFNEIEHGVVLVDFYADWCWPCKMLTPVLEVVANENSNIKIIKVNIDNSKNLSMYYKVFSIPTVILMKNGKEIHRIVGFNTKEQINELIAKVN